MQSFAKPLKHKPCRLLGNTKGAVNLHARDAVFAVDQHPECGHPFIHAEGRILEDRIDFESELLVAPTAEPDFASLNKVVLIRGTARANDLAIGPAQFDGVIESAVRIGEVNNSFL